MSKEQGAMSKEQGAMVPFVIVSAHGVEPPGRNWVYNTYPPKSFRYFTDDGSEIYNANPSTLTHAILGSVISIKGNGAFIDVASGNKQSAARFVLVVDRAALTYRWSVQGHPDVIGALDASLVAVW